MRSILRRTMLLFIPALMLLLMGTWPFLGGLILLVSALISAALFNLAVQRILKQMTNIPELIAKRITQAISFAGFPVLPYFLGQPIRQYFGTPVRDYEIDLLYIVVLSAGIGCFTYFGVPFIEKLNNTSSEKNE